MHCNASSLIETCTAPYQFIIIMHLTRKSSDLFMIGRYVLLDVLFDAAVFYMNINIMI